MLTIIDMHVGTYQSPKILELSGIGDPAVLSTFNISTVVNLTSVGGNMQVCIHSSAYNPVEYISFSLTRTMLLCW